jgi:hypothetical protein
MLIDSVGLSFDAEEAPGLVFAILLESLAP